MKGLFRNDCPPAYPERKFPKFCGNCGSPLVAECTQIGYDENTGAPTFTRWKHCPRWTGGRQKLRTPEYVESAAELVETFDARKHAYSFVYWERDYLDCRPAYEPPAAPAQTTGDC